jgi:hypothetical protein
MRHVKQQLLFTFRVETDQPIVVVIEPAGGEYDLAVDDEVRVSVFGATFGADDPDTDLTVEVQRAEGRITLWVHALNYDVTNKAGKEWRSRSSPL